MSRSWSIFRLEIMSVVSNFSGVRNYFRYFLFISVNENGLLRLKSQTLDNDFMFYSSVYVNKFSEETLKER